MEDKTIRDLIAHDEGKVLKVYKDSLGYLTVGIGHKVTSADGLYLNDIISEERCNKLFDKDFKSAVSGCEQNIKEFKTFPDRVKYILVNMSFNMGIYGVLKFKNFIASIIKKDYIKAEKDLINSIWYKQVTNRAKRLIQLLKG